MSKSSVISDLAPKAIGPYSQGVEAGGLVFVSGQIPADPGSGQLAPGGIREQTEQALRNVEGILRSCGLSLQHVVKTTVYMKNLGDFAAMNEVYSRFFKEPYPARATIEVSNLPKSAQVEIEAIAAK